MPSILKGNNSIISGNTTFTVRPMFGNNTPWDSANQPVQVLGQCRFVWTSATVCTLKPYNGNQLFIGGSYYTIPYAGVPITADGLTPSTLYYVYATVVANNISLIASTTAHGLGGLWGNEVMNGDALKSLVGMFYVATDGKFYDTAGLRLVASWFNRKARSSVGAYVSINTTSTTYTETSQTARASILTWGDEHTFLGLLGVAYGNTNGATCTVALYIDSATSGTGLSVVAPAAYNQQNITHSTGYALTEGYHLLSSYVAVSAGTGYFSCLVSGTIAI